MRSRDLLIAAFLASRIIMGFVADNPEVYPPGSADAGSDVANYADFAEQMRDDGSRPYRDFHVGYPPASLPVILAPDLLGFDDYRTSFIVESVALDALGFWAILRVSRRRGSWWGALAWLVLMPLLGPVAYTRLDMAVAASVAWALERLERGRWSSASLLLGIGTAIKVTPAFLVPLVVLAAPKRWRTAAAAAVGSLIFLIPFTSDLGAIYDEVMAGNVDRGVHSESLWGSLALLARVTIGTTADVVYEFGAWDVDASYVPALKTVANIVAVVVLLAGVAFTARRVERGNADRLIVVVTATLLLLTAVGRVFSPQYLAWLIPLVAVSVAIAPRDVQPAAIAFSIAVALSHVMYPVIFRDYLAAYPPAVLVAVIRNAVLLGSGLLFAAAAWERSGPPTARDTDAREPAAVIP